MAHQVIEKGSQNQQIEGKHVPPSSFTDNDKSCQKVSVAIDFGTSNCAVAYSTALKKEDVQVINEWQDGAITHGKIPTAILFDEQQTFVAFGNEARDKYRDLQLDGKAENHFFFQRFKMQLYDEKKVSNEMLLTDESGKTMNAKTVFTSAIKFIREFVLEVMSKRGVQYSSEHEINWVITVPAIWSNKAKQFTRESAVAAGCLNRNVVIALEPEAASIFSQNQPDSAFAELFKNGIKYLVIDNGGGTVDVTVHQYEKKDFLKEIYRVSGGNMGGLKVDQLFVDLLEKLFSKANIDQIKTQAYDEWMKLQTDFEKVKRKIKSQNNVDTISIGTSKQCPWDRDHFNNFPKADKQGIELKTGGRLVISTSIIKDMINQVAVSIKSHIADILKEIDISSLDAILMVGGFSNSGIVLEEMKKLVSDQVPLIVPANAELSIVMGAVLFGWTSNVIRVRKSKMTYGILVGHKFIEGYHDEEKCYFDDKGIKRCRDCFKKLVTINQDIEVNQDVEISTFHPCEDLDVTNIELLATTNVNPKYKNDNDVILIGRIVTPRTKENQGKSIITKLYFGDTEIHIKVFDEATKKTYEDCFDFLYVNQAKFIE